MIYFLGSAMVPKSQKWQFFMTMLFWKTEPFTLNLRQRFDSMLAKVPDKAQFPRRNDHPGPRTGYQALRKHSGHPYDQPAGKENTIPEGEALRVASPEPEARLRSGPG